MSNTCCNRFFRGEAWACFLLRMWIGMRLMFAGLTKFLKKNEEGTFEFNTENAAATMENITGPMKNFTAIPEWAIDQFATVLPWALLIIGCWLIVGLFSRIALFAAGGLILSLSMGLMMLPDDVAAVQRGVEILVIALALITVKHNILAVDNLIHLAMGGDRGDRNNEPPRRQKD